MYVLIYFLSLGIIIFVTNKTNEVESNDEFLQWQTQDLLILGGLFLLSVVLQILDFIIPKIFMAVYLLIAVLAIFYVNKNREKHILEYKEQVSNIYNALANLIGKPKGPVDYNELPFTFERTNEQVSRIDVIMNEPSKFKDDACTNATFSLNRFFPHLQWKFVIDFPSQTTSFIGEKLPPDLAKWPGTDFRPGSLIPLGMAGSGEVCMDLGTKDPGESSFYYEDGTHAGTVKLPTSPQWMVLGAPLALDTIIPTFNRGNVTMKDIKRGDLVIDRFGKPTKVLGCSPIHQSDNLCELELKYNDETVTLKADYPHHFPIIINNEIMDMTVKEIEKVWSEAQILGIYNDNEIKWDITSFIHIPDEPVKCILVDSPTHLFAVTDKIMRDNRQATPFVLTHNTGGGKSIACDQEMWDK